MDKGRYFFIQEKLMGRVRTGLFFLFVCMCCTGMGGGNNDLLTRIPVPDREFRVEVTDTEDTRYAVSSFSVDGLTVLPVSLGKILVGIDFADIDSMTLFLGEASLTADIVYISGQRKEVSLKKDLFFYGQSQWGKMKIHARDCRQVRFVR